MVAKADEIFMSTRLDHESKVNELYDLIQKEQNPRFYAQCPNIKSLNKFLKKEGYNSSIKNDRIIIKAKFSDSGMDWVNSYSFSPFVAWVKFIHDNPINK